MDEILRRTNTAGRNKEFEIRIRSEKLWRSLDDGRPDEYSHYFIRDDIRTNHRGVSTKKHCILSTHIKIGAYECKVSLSRETSTSEVVTHKNALLIRFRRRKSIIRKKWRIDLTRVYELPPGAFYTAKAIKDAILDGTHTRWTYEVEYEYTGRGPITTEDIDEILGMNMLPIDIRGRLATLHKKKFYGSDLKAIVNQPKSATVEDWRIINANQKGYLVFDKTDGERCLLHGKKAYFAGKILPIEEIPGAGKSIFDAEYLNGVYYVFDVLSSANITLLQRLAIINGIQWNPGFIGKKSRSVNMDLEELKRECHERSDIDGFIFSSLSGDYYNTTHFKWKLRHTIDFQVIGYDLYVFGDTVHEKYQPVIYHSMCRSPIFMQEPTICELEITRTPAGIKFDFLRARPDKKKANHKTIVEKTIFASIIDADHDYFTKLSGTELFNVRKYNLRVKAMLLYQLRGMDTVIDIGCGTGQDMAIYEAFHVKNVIAIDSSIGALEKLLTNWRAAKPVKFINLPDAPERTNPILIHERITTTTPILRVIQEKYCHSTTPADAIVCNFSIHYFYDGNPATLHSMLDESLAIFGFIIFTGFNYKRVSEAMRQAPEQDKIKHLNLGSVEIKKDPVDKSHISVKMPFTGNEFYRERLINFSEIIDYFEKKNYTLHQRGFFDEHASEYPEFSKEWTPGETKLVSFYEYVVLFKGSA